MRKHRSLLLILLIALCATVIVGSTLAYYTDEELTDGKVITSGDLEMSFEWANNLNETWQRAEESGPVFNQTHWEPNFTAVRYFRVKNTGDMAFQYELNVVPTIVPEEGVNLMDVIDVYSGVVDDNAAINASNYATALQKVGTLSELLHNENGAYYGIVLPDDKQGTLPDGVTAHDREVTFCVALHMQHTAGNEYMGVSVGEGFDVQLVATQYTYETDAFGNLFANDAQLPDVEYATSKTVSVTPDQNGCVPYDIVFISETGVTATVPQGARMEDGATQLILIVYPKAKSEAKLTLADNETVKAWEVKVEGLADDNTVPVRFFLPQAMPKALNIGNYALYHVENGISVPMTRVEEITAESAHNSFTYNPATGDMGLALATFSEIAVVAEPAKWEGNYDYFWYTNAVTLLADDKGEYVIANADQLAAFGAIVGGMNGQTEDSFSGKTVKLIADINLGDKESENNPNLIFYPIGYYNSEGTYERTNTAITSGLRNFEGIFDGNGHTIANFYQNTWEMKGDNNYYDAKLQYYRDGMGLFGRVYGGTVKNLTVENFSSDGEYTTTGVIAAYADGATFENIAVVNCNPRVYNIGNGGIVGCVGWYAKEPGLKSNFTNITVDNSNKISALWGSWDVACGGLVGQYYPTSGQSSANYPVNGGIHFENCHVSAIMDVYNDVCGNYQYYWYRYSGMMIGSIRENKTDDLGYTVPDPSGIKFCKCTVTYGPWADYVYCEFTENSQASYTEDYQFSRVEAEDLETVGDQIKCKHSHKDVEDKRAVLLPFDQLFNGYGYGVKAVSKYDGVTVYHKNDDGGLKESAEKFVYVGNDTLEADRVYTIKELFKFIDGKLNVSSTGVVVSITDLDSADGVVSAEYTVTNQMGWEENTIQFTGTGNVKLIIQDYYFCTPTTIIVNIKDKEAAEKFETKFAGDFLYRVGNQNAVRLDSLFKAKEGAEIGTVDVTVEAVEGTGVSGTYTSNATWTDGTIQFSGTGVVKVTITDNDYCTPTELYLEVVDAKNVTGIENATANNVVLLNDCGVSSLTVSGRYAFYGNGFTATYTGNGQYLNNGLKHGIVEVSENGTLDNLRIKASIYPAAYLYYGYTQYGDYVQGGPSSVEGEKTRYHYQLSAVAASGNATVSNCYIYGGRNNIFVNTGDVTIKDSVLECGTLANVQIQSTSEYTVTLENVTTIQYQVKASVGDTSKVMLGAGVIVGPDDNSAYPKIALNGDFKQYNWVTKEDADTVSNKTTGSLIDAAVNTKDYNHTINGKTASNMGIVNVNMAEMSEDSIKNNTGLPYVWGKAQASVSGISATGQVYSLQNASEKQIYSDYENADRATVNGLYQPQFKYFDDLGGQYIEKTDDGDEHCYREGDIIHVMFPFGDTKELDLAALVDIQKYTDQDLNLEINCKDENDNAVTVTDGKVSLTDAGKYIVTYAATDTLFYDKDANKIVRDSVKYSWDVTVSVSLKDTKIPDARFVFDATKQKMGYYKPALGDVKQYLPFLAGLKIYDYNGKTEYLRFDGDADYNKVASITITGYASNKASVEVKLTDGGVINTQFLARANSGGASTYTGKIKTKNNVIYFVNDGGTSNKDTTTTAAYWYVDYYKFTGNNGVAIQSAQQTFNSTGSSASTPSGNFSTTIKYTVTYDANGGNCGQTTGYATSASTAVTLPTPTRSGYMFVGWYTAASGGTRVGGAGESYTPSANLTLYAQWGKPCTVTYNANGGSCGTASEKYTGTALTLPTTTRDGYWFIGWYDAAEGGNKIGDAGATYNPGSEITLYAHWQEAVEYTVTYNANGGTCGTASATYQGTALTLPTPTRTGYTFNGWYTAASGGTKIGDAGASYIPSANITLYAQWQINSYTIKVTTSNATVKVNGTAVNNNGTVSIQYGAQVTVEVTYSQSNSKSTTIKGEDKTTYNSPFTMPAQNVTINATSSGSCVTPDTLITLADGSKKEIQYVNYEDQLLVWDFYKGEYAAVPAAIIFDHGYDDNTVIKMSFEDGTVVKVVNSHQFVDADVNDYVTIVPENAMDYVGHRFVKRDGNGYRLVKLEKVDISEEYVQAFGVISALHYNILVEDVFSADYEPADVGLFNYFAIGEGMKFDEAAMQADIEKYGLYSYEEFADCLTEEQFEAFNVKYMKVAVGKGQYTFEGILKLVEEYLK